MRRFRIAKVTDIQKVTKAIKHIFNPSAKEFGYDLSSKEPYCQIKNKFYLIKDLSEMSEFKSSLKKSLEEKINNAIKKFKLNGLNIDIDKLADDEKVNKLLTDEKFLEKKGIFFDKETSIYFVETKNSLPEILGSNEEDDSDPKKEKIVKGGDINKFKWVRNKDGYIGLRNPNGKLIINFKQKFNDIVIDRNRKIVLLIKNKKYHLYNIYGKPLNDKIYDDIFPTSEIGLPNYNTEVCFRIGDYFGVVDTNGKDIISEDEKIENYDDLKEAYERIENQEEENENDDYNNQNYEENEDEEVDEIEEIKIKDNILKGNPKQIKQNITRILQKNGYNVIISKRKRKF